MRFFLDHDVDAEVLSALVTEGHEAWTASGAGLSSAADDDLTVYACRMNACLVTHDREFSVRRRANAIGHHIWLTCAEWDAAKVLTEALPDLIPIFERHPDVMITLHTSGEYVVKRDWT